MQLDRSHTCLIASYAEDTRFTVTAYLLLRNAHFLIQVHDAGSCNMNMIPDVYTLNVLVF